LAADDTQNNIFISFISRGKKLVGCCNRYRNGIPYHNELILVKQPIEKPHGGAEGKKQGQCKWHVLYTLGFYDLPLQLV